MIRSRGGDFCVLIMEVFICGHAVRKRLLPITGERKSVCVCLYEYIKSTNSYETNIYHLSYNIHFSKREYFEYVYHTKNEIYEYQIRPLIF